jgi:hypothetical protein
MRDFAEDTSRTHGPAVVRSGPSDEAGSAPVVVVVDPGGTASHGELPATWRPLTEHLHVVWCRLPAADGPWRAVDEVLEGLTGRGGTVHVVTSGPVAENVLDVASRHSALLDSVLLVDPEAGDAPVPAAAEQMARSVWDERTMPQRRDLAAAGVEVRVVARSHAGDTDRIDPPLPLGHPEVVMGVTRELLALGEHPSPHVDPARASVLGDAVSAVLRTLENALDRVRHT